MSVINSTEHYLFERAKCSVCRGNLSPPFVSWDGDELAILRICKTCCQKIKNGLMADLVQVAAVADLRDLGQNRMTLVRTSREEAREEERKEKEKVFGLNPTEV